MKHPFLRILPALPGLLLCSCVPLTSPEAETRTIPAVTPHRALSDEQITVQYLARMVELQRLNKEMEAANNAKDFGTVHTKAQDGLERAREARDLAQHLDDPAERKKRLEGIDKIIADLEKLVEMTGV